MTYADTSILGDAIPWRWDADSQNRLQVLLSTVSTRTGQWYFWQEASNIDNSVVSATNAISPGINVPYNIASRHGSTFVNGAEDGTVLTANTSPTALPDLSSTDLSLGFDYMGNIGTFRVWSQDIGDDGIEEATA